MKKIGLLTAGIACAVSLVIGASAAGIVQTINAELRPDFEIVIDGKKQEFKNASGETVYPILYDGTTYLPVRAIGEMMGKTVYWYQDDKRIELKDEETLVTDADVIVAGKADKNTASAGKGSADIASSGEITLSDAKKIALDKAGLDAIDVNDVIFTEAKRERDNGIYVYEIEFRKDGIKYSAEIKAADGSIVSWETEGAANNGTASDRKITLDDAKKIALDKAGLSEGDVVFTKAKTDREDGVDVYEIEFKNGRTEYSAEVRVSDGSIISWEVEKDN